MKIYLLPSKCCAGKANIICIFYPKNSKEVAPTNSEF
jgi:hypothetical protein